jgi:hypothetical protein
MGRFVVAIEVLRVSGRRGMPRSRAWRFFTAPRYCSASSENIRVWWQSECEARELTADNLGNDRGLPLSRTSGGNEEVGGIVGLEYVLVRRSYDDLTGFLGLAIKSPIARNKGLAPIGSLPLYNPKTQGSAHPSPSTSQAIDYFYTDTTAQANASSSKSAASNDKKIGQVWDKYKGASFARSLWRRADEVG